MGLHRINLRSLSIYSSRMESNITTPEPAIGETIRLTKPKPKSIFNTP